VEVDKQGLHKAVDSDDESEEDEAPKLVEAETKTGDTKKKWPKKPRKQKFRYESKVERKMNRAKQKAGNKKRADARKGD
jgi:ribosomal RNA-processing protein 17